MLNVAIAGASGYSGAELMRILVRHPDVRLRTVLAGKNAGERVDALYPDLARRIDLSFGPLDPTAVRGADVLFLALPSGEAMRFLPGVCADVGRVIDLSGDFRLSDADVYRRYYRHEHAAPELLGSAVYGLPELYRDRIAQATLVANPGCYPTGALLALLPALKERIIDPASIVIASMSGVSGAGRSSSVEMSFAEVNENVRPYKVGTHQHIPEIEAVLREASGSAVRLTFIPHLIPVTRGISTTIVADLARPLSQEEVLECYAGFYHGAPFVRITSLLPEIRHVVRTNYCDIGAVIEARTSRLILLSVIDNMLKGAAGQAVQNMNIMTGFPEGVALL